MIDCIKSSFPCNMPYSEKMDIFNRIDLFPFRMPFNWIDAMRTGAWDKEYFILKCYYSYLGFDILRPKHKNTCSVKN